MRKLKGQNVKIKSQPQSSFFTSTSTRSFDPELERNIKFHWPAAGQYEEKRALGKANL